MNITILFSKKNISNYLIFTSLILFLLLVIFLSFGGHIFVVKSDSMYPNISMDSLIFVFPKDEYKNGDVISFGSNYTVVTHRIVSISDYGDIKKYVTKGDANDFVDKDPVSRSKVIGKVYVDSRILGWIFANIII